MGRGSFSFVYIYTEDIPVDRGETEFSGLTIQSRSLDASTERPWISLVYCAAPILLCLGCVGLHYLPAEPLSPPPRFQEIPAVPSVLQPQTTSTFTMVKALSFKGDKKPKKRKRTAGVDDDGAVDSNGGRQLKATKSAKEDEDAENPDDDDSWVSADVLTDIAGPIMFVLPTEPPTALACDANGKVFTIPIENIVDGNPSTAEPHDVRQVWIANRIVGTENYRFKGHHGKYANKLLFNLSFPKPLSAYPTD